MPITPAEKTAIEEVINAIISATSPRGRRQLAAIFMDLVDRKDYPEYYEVIPEPRCLKNIQSGVAKGRYKEATDVYTDLSLVFWNALFYNEAESQIATDAQTLKDLLETEWKKRSVLPGFRTSPPPSSAQKVHGVPNDAESSSAATAKEESSAATPSVLTPAPPTPAPAAPAPLPASTAPIATASTSTTSTAQRAVVPTPTASTSTAANPNFLQPKPVPIRPKSAQRQTPEIDVEGISPGESEEHEEEGPAFQVERDPQSEEIVKQLERGLPRWPGLGPEGWMHEVHPERMSDIVHAIKTYKDVVGNRLAVCLESVPEESSPTLHLSITTPLSLKQIETRTRHKMYKSSRDFDRDMMCLFEKARRWHDPGTEAYGRTLLLQRLYQALTSPNPPAPPYISSTNFAGLRAGPGTVKPVHGADSEGVANVTTHRVLSRDRTFVDEINYKGWKVRLADWVHLANPDDPSRPIIGQVFRCWTSDEIEKKGQYGITVSWYYRPEQTFHPATRQFWENEVFKTSHFADHPVEDIIEKVACQFTARHLRGRPRPPYWYPGFPLYVCDARYNDRDQAFVRIKNWNSCVPEEVRQSTEFMPIYPFERMVYPVRVPSPFLVKGAGAASAGGKGKGPGGIIATPHGEAEDDGGRKKGRNDATGPGGVVASANAYASVRATPSVYTPSAIAPTPTYAAASYPNPTQMYAALPQTQPQVGQRSAVGPDRSVVTAAGGLAAIGGPAQVEKLPQETGMWHLANAYASLTNLVYLFLPSSNPSAHLRLFD
ncbi:hypothetical protein D9613_001420 [Agrocybe pediades]|uniref:Uncharacterized protein n=1 Tax=Agrocybe pediades TaxID=84607 RepID=A0A8H4VWV9_9AGAR|nr:hypothetical protein D9613_001420 [Agrocybe pediades]